jgi:hypothetical protein
MIVIDFNSMGIHQYYHHQRNVILQTANRMSFESSSISKPANEAAKNEEKEICKCVNKLTAMSRKRHAHPTPSHPTQAKQQKPKQKTNPILPQSPGIPHNMQQNQQK